MSDLSHPFIFLDQEFIYDNLSSFCYIPWHSLFESSLVVQRLWLKKSLESVLRLRSYALHLVC